MPPRVLGEAGPSGRPHSSLWENLPLFRVFAQWFAEQILFVRGTGTTELSELFATMRGNTSRYSYLP
jgi:hypothetical protein